MQKFNALVWSDVATPRHSFIVLHLQHPLHIIIVDLVWFLRGQKSRLKPLQSLNLLFDWSLYTYTRFQVHKLLSMHSFFLWSSWGNMRQCQYGSPFSFKYYSAVYHTTRPSTYIINEVLVMFFHDHPYLFHCVIKRLSSLHWEHHIMFHAWFSLIDICCNTSYRSYISRFFQSYQLRPIVNHTQLT